MALAIEAKQVNGILVGQLLPKGACTTMRRTRGSDYNTVFAAGGKNDADIADLFLV